MQERSWWFMKITGFSNHGSQGRMLERRHVRFLGVLILAVLPSASLAGTFSAFGPEDFSRQTGKPALQSRSFSVINPNTAYTMVIDNGGSQQQFERISAGSVQLNAAVIIGPNSWNQQVQQIRVPVALTANNELTVELGSRPQAGITIRVLGVDDEAPTITATVDPAPNPAGWNNQSSVTVTFHCSDGISGIASCMPPVTLTGELKNYLVSGTATDRAGNSSSTTVSVNLDHIGPVLQIDSPANGAVVHAAPVTVKGTVEDALSGVDSVQCNGNPATITDLSFSCEISIPEGVSQITVQGRDVAQNESQASIQIELQPTDRPESPETITIEHGEGEGSKEIVGLHWLPSRSKDIIEYRVYRGLSLDQLALVHVVPSESKPTVYYFYDEDVEYDSVIFYAISAVDRNNIESRISDFLPAFIKSLQTTWRFPKLSTPLNELYEVTHVLSSEHDLQIAVSRIGHGMVSHLPPHAASVNITTDQDPAPQQYFDQIHQLGIETLDVHAGSWIFALVPPDKFKALSELSFVIKVTDDRGSSSEKQVTPPQGSVNGTILSIIGARILHLNEIYGNNIRIVNVGSGKVSNAHDRIMEEIIRITAPGSIVDTSVPGDKYDSNFWLYHATLDALRKNPDIVNLSVGSGASIRTATRLDDLVQTHSDVLFVVSSGNEANAHLQVSMKDDGHGYSILGSEGFINPINAGGKTIQISAYSPEIRRANIDLFVCNPICITVNQNGDEALAEEEFLWVEGSRFAVKMGEKDDVDGDGQTEYINQGRLLHITVTGKDVELPNPEPNGSIMGIAALPSVMTVGGSVKTLLNSVPDVVWYGSCRGPGYMAAPLVPPSNLGFSYSGVQKPDLVAPAIVELLDGTFPEGTSASAAWTSGAVALMMQAYRQINPVNSRLQALRFLSAQTLAQRLSLEPLPTLSYGWGRLEISLAWVWATNGQSLYLITPDGKIYFAQDMKTYILNMAAEPATGALWYIDAVNRRICRVKPGDPSVCYNAGSRDYPEAVACDPATNTCWVSALDTLGVGEQRNRKPA
jgi:hypothetical protein